MEITKKEFKQKIASNVRMLYRKDIEEASKQQLFQAVSYALKDYIIDMWMDTHKTYGKVVNSLYIFLFISLMCVHPHVDDVIL